MSIARVTTTKTRKLTRVLRHRIENTLRSAGFTVYTDDNNYPLLQLQVFWDTENSVSGNIIGQSYAEVLTVFRLLPATKDNNPAGKPYIVAGVWYNMWEDLTSRFDLQGAFIEGAGKLTDSLLGDFRSLPTVRK